MLLDLHTGMQTTFASRDPKYTLPNGNALLWRLTSTATSRAH